MDYPKIIDALLQHFIHSEGTDYLGSQGQVEDALTWPTLTDSERTELTRLRDKARTATGWHGYTP